MVVEILGGGCKNCEILEKNTRAALTTKGIEAQVVKVKEMEKIMAYGVMSTPALVIDGKVKSFGKVLSEKDVLKILEEN